MLAPPLKCSNIILVIILLGIVSCAEETESDSESDAKIMPWPITESERQLLRKRLESDSDNLQQEFAKLVNSVNQYMVNCEVHSSGLSLALITYDSSLKKKIGEYDGCQEILLKMSKYWSFYDYNFLKFIVKTVCTSYKRCEYLLQGYVSHFERFCKYRLYESPSGKAEASEQKSGVVMLIDDRMNLKGCTWQDLQKLQEVASEVTGVRIESLYSCTDFKEIDRAHIIMQQEPNPSRRDSCLSTDLEVCDIELRGVDKLSETELVVNDSWESFQWNGYGLKVDVQSDSLPSNMDSCTITIKASLSGQYQLPPNTHLISPVFWLHCTPRCKFNFPVTLEIQHCAPLRNSFRLFMAGASSAQKDLPYSFKVLHGGSFSENISYGTIDLSQFGGIAVVQERADERRYWSNVFAMGPANHKTVHFTVTWDDEAHITVSLLLII